MSRAEKLEIKQIAQKLGPCKLCIHLRCGKGTDLILVKSFNSTL